MNARSFEEHPVTQDACFLVIYAQGQTFGLYLFPVYVQREKFRL